MKEQICIALAWCFVLASFIMPTVLLSVYCALVGVWFLLLLIYLRLATLALPAKAQG